MMGTKFKKSFLGGLFLALAPIPFLISPSLAVETRWKGSPGADWNVSTNWDPTGVPAKDDDVIIAQPGNDVLYTNPSNNPTLNSLRMGLDLLFSLDPENPPLEISLTQTQDVLTVKNSEIGTRGTANYTQNGGTHKVLQDLTMGATSDGQGNYTMMGGSLSVGGHETLGLAGEGYLLQLGSTISSGRPPSLGCTPPPVTPPPPVGPTHTVGKNLYLGVESTSDGEINLSDTSLTVGGSTRVGIKGTGLFDQNNSIVKIKGNDPEPLVGEGTLSYSPAFSARSKKDLKTNKLECVPSRGPGLIVGLENEGQYNLKGGTLNVNYSEIIGLDEGGEGYFSQADGTHTINGNLYLGKEAKSYGDFLLSVTTPASVGLLDVHGFASVGYLGEGSFSQTGGTFKIWGIDQEVNLKGKLLSTTLSKGASLSCSQQQYIGFTVGRGGIGNYFLNGGELLVSRGEVIGMHSGSNGTFEQIGGKHFIGGNLTIARDEDSSGSYLLGNPPDYDEKPVPTPVGVMLKVQGSLLNNEGGIFKFYGGELLANVINKGTFTAYGPGTRTFPKQFFNYGTFEFKGAPLGTAAFAQKFRNYGVYKSMGNPGVESRFTYLYIAPQGYIEAGVTDNYYITKEFTNTSSKKTEWKTDTANLIFTGPGRKPLKTGSAPNGVSGFADNFAWGSIDIAEGSVRLLGHLYADQIREVKFNEQTNKITNLFGYCGGQIHYNNSVPELSGKILTNIYGRQVGYFTNTGYVSDCK